MSNAVSPIFCSFCQVHHLSSSSSQPSSIPMSLHRTWKNIGTPIMTAPYMRSHRPTSCARVSGFVMCPPRSMSSSTSPPPAAQAPLVHSHENIACDMRSRKLGFAHAYRIGSMPPTSALMYAAYGFSSFSMSNARPSRAQRARTFCAIWSAVAILVAFSAYENARSDPRNMSPSSRESTDFAIASFPDARSMATSLCLSCWTMALPSSYGLTRRSVSEMPSASHRRTASARNGSSVSIISMTSLKPTKSRFSVSCSVVWNVLSNLCVNLSRFLAACGVKLDINIVQNPTAPTGDSIFVAIGKNADCWTESVFE